MEHAPSMTYLVAIIAGLIGAAVGWIAGVFADPFVAPWLTFANIPFVGPIVGIVDAREICAGIGLIVATLLAIRFYGGYRTGPGIFARSLLAVIVSSALIVGVLEAGGALLDTLGLNPLAPVVEFEIRFPPGSNVPTTRDEILVELHTDRNQIIATVNGIERAGDRPLLRGSAPLVFRTAQRTIVMSLSGEPIRVFRLRLPARPSPTAEFSPWQQVDFLEEAQRARRTDVTADYAIRYRVN
jgi:hypothetical protein